MNSRECLSELALTLKEKIFYSSIMAIALGGIANSIYQHFNQSTGKDKALKN